MHFSSKIVWDGIIPMAETRRESTTDRKQEFGIGNEVVCECGKVERKRESDVGGRKGRLIIKRAGYVMTCPARH